jgi:DNA processing protein
MTAEVIAGHRDAGSNRDGVDDQSREICVWLGSLSSWRQGLVKRLIQQFGSVARVIERHPAELADIVASGGGRRARSVRDATQDPAASSSALDISADETAFRSVLHMSPREHLRALERRGAPSSVVAWCDPLFPPALRALPDPPLCLFVRCACPADELAERLRTICTHPLVAVVGTRTPSVYGEEMAAILGRDLTSRGAIVVSGLAMGIDATAQAAAVRAAHHGRRPSVVGVLGCGPDITYPRCNAALFADITRSGLLLSEFHWGVPPRPWRFPARNRVMAGLARAVVVVEGAARSGARVTADHALELGREVLAVPGEAGRRLTAAPHLLIRQGAGLCESADDILAAIAPLGLPDASLSTMPAPSHNHPSSALLNPDGAVSAVLRALESGSMTADKLSRRSGIPVYEAASILSELEVDGIVRVSTGGAYRLRRH